MPDYIDVTDQCTFSPDTGTPVTQSGDVTVSYVKDGVQLTNTIRINAYPRSTFNMPYNISESIRDCSNLFNGCSNFCQNVILPSSASNCAFTFNGCTNFKGDIDIPSGVHVANSMFNGCSGPLNINFNLQLSGPTSYYDVYKMCARSGITKNRININFTGEYYNAADTRNILNNIVGSEIAFENNQDNHCYYNTSENLYIYGLDMTVYEKILDELKFKGYPGRTIPPQLRYPSNRLFDAGDTELIAKFTDGTTEYVNYQTPGLVFSPYNHGERVDDVGSGQRVGTVEAYYTYGGVTKSCSFSSSGSYVIEPNITFNKPYNISNAITDCNHLFDGCYNLDSTVNIGRNVTNCAFMFNNCRNFNNNIMIDYQYGSILNCYRMFFRCYKFDKPLNQETNFNILDTVRDCSQMFSSCWNFNQNVKIGSNVINAHSMFDSCEKLDKSIIMGDNLIDCSGMFMSCSNFNQPIIIPDKVIYCNDMFASAYNFNQDISINGNVTNLAYMFRETNLNNVNVNINIDSQTSNILGAFSYINQGFNIYLNDANASGFGKFNMFGLLEGRSGDYDAPEIYIHCENYYNLVNVKQIVFPSSPEIGFVVGARQARCQAYGITISW